MMLLFKSLIQFSQDSSYGYSLSKKKILKVKRRHPVSCQGHSQIFLSLVTTASIVTFYKPFTKQICELTTLKTLTLTVLEPSKLAFVYSADQDQTAQNVQSDL